MEYFKVSAHYPELYCAVAKIFEDYGVSKDIKVVLKEKISDGVMPTKNECEASDEKADL